jgi:hypothetical protein
VMHAGDPRRRRPGAADARPLPRLHRLRPDCSRTGFTENGTTRFGPRRPTVNESVISLQLLSEPSSDALCDFSAIAHGNAELALMLEHQPDRPPTLSNSGHQGHSPQNTASVYCFVLSNIGA